MCGSNTHKHSKIEGSGSTADRLHVKKKESVLMVALNNNRQKKIENQIWFRSQETTPPGWGSAVNIAEQEQKDSNPNII